MLLLPAAGQSLGEYDGRCNRLSAVCLCDLRGEQNHRLSKIIINIVGGGFITIMALLALQLPWPFPVRMDKLIIGSILPLVPGLAFVNSIRDIANSDFISGIVRIVDALLVFVYIAIGVGFVLGCFNKLTGGVML